MAMEDPEMAYRGPSPIAEETSTLFATRRCCFCIPCFPSRRSSTAGLAWWQRFGPAQTDERWWTRGRRALWKLREWSEIVAGPKWKTFIRRFNRNRSGGGSSGNRHGKFQYDPLSYSLNFDEGPGQNGNSDEDVDYVSFRNFSTRYASASGKPSPGIVIA